MTKSRLKRMLENVLLEDKSLTGYESEASNALLQSRKRLLQSTILVGRGSYVNGKNLLLQVISTAKKYDLADELFQAEFLLSRFQIIKTSVKDYQKQTEKLLKLNQDRSLIAEAQILHYAIKNLLTSRTLSAEELTDVRGQIDRMAVIVEQTQHPAAKYVYFLSEVYYYQMIDLPQAAYDFCQKFLELIQQTASQNTMQRTTTAYTQLAQVSLQLDQFEEARSSAQAMLNLLEKENMKDEINYLRGLELRFLIEYYDQNHEESQLLIQQAQQHPAFEASKIIAAKWHYFEACLLFLQRDFRAAYQKLDETTPLLADKQGMNVYIRLLEIMILYELQLDDLMDTKILNMRQFVKRTRKGDAESRPKQLVKLLMHWYRKEYDFAAAHAYLNTLEQPEQTSSYSGTELLKFEDWLLAKV